MLACVCGGLLFATSLVAPAAVGADEEPLLRQFQEQLNHQWFSLGALIQIVGSSGLRSEADRGFEIASLRVKLKGEFDEGYNYVIQVNLHKATTLLDARLSYEFAEGISLDMGAFKAPFSAEVLTSASAIDFVNRSVAASVLTPGRQIGVGVRGSAGGGVQYAAGVFNGNGVTANGNDDNDFLYVGRVGMARDAGPLHVQTGANATYETRTPAPGGPDDTDRRCGADIRAESDRVFVSGEFIYMEMEREVASKAATSDARGFHVTGGVRPSERTQVLLRLDGFSGYGVDEYNHVITAGLNFWPTSVTEFQVNLVVPTEGDFEDGRLLVNAQISF